MQDSSTSHLTTSKAMTDRFISNRKDWNKDLSNFKLNKKIETSELSKCLGTNLFGTEFMEHKTLNSSVNASTTVPIKRAYDDDIIVKKKDITRDFSGITPYKILDAPNVLNDYYLNLMNWSSKDVLAVALGGVLYIYPMNMGKVVRALDCDSLVGVNREGTIRCVEFSADGERVIYGVANGNVFITDVYANGETNEFTYDSLGTLPTCCSWGKSSMLRSIFGIGSTGGYTRIFDIRSGKIKDMTDHAELVCTLKWSPCGNMLASGSNDNSVAIYDIRTWKVMTLFKKHKACVKAVEWSEKEHGIIYTGGGSEDRNLYKWNSANGSIYKSFRTSTQTTAIHYHPLGYIVTTHGWMSNKVKILTSSCLSQVHELSFHRERILYSAMSPDKTSVATMAPDETLAIWKIFPEYKPNKKNYKKNEPSTLDGNVSLR